MANAIFQGTDENIFAHALWSGTAPADTYSLATYASLNPAARVLYSAGTATVTATIPSARGDVLVIPVTNATSLTITNGGGLNENIPIPTMTRNGIPRTIVCDLTALESNNTTRTSTTWNLVFVCSTANVIVGAAIALYSPKTAFALGDFQWGGTESRETFGVEHKNTYGTRYLQPNETILRSVSLVKIATQSDLTAVQDWFDASWGSFDKSLLWPDPDVNDAYLGTLAEKLDVTRLAPTWLGPLFSVAVQFEELSKGRPV